MKWALTEKLFKKYPIIFQDKDEPITKSLIAFGLECDSGWYDLIDELCQKLTELKDPPIATQIKEKYGRLCFYVREGSEEALSIISDAEKKSLTICELCGKKGSLKQKHLWFKTVCDIHAQEKGYEEYKN